MLMKSNKSHHRLILNSSDLYSMSTLKDLLFHIQEHRFTIKQIKECLLTYNITLMIVGPEIPLIEGLVDFVENDPEISHVLTVGPSKKGALLEGSKDFSKEFMHKHNIPTASYKTFDRNSVFEGLAYLENIKPPYVLKADGPAAGKGVVILSDLNNILICSIISTGLYCGIVVLNPVPIPVIPLIRTIGSIGT